MKLIYMKENHGFRKLKFIQLFSAIENPPSSYTGILHVARGKKKL